MPALQLADFKRPANLLSLLRIPLGLVFPFTESTTVRLAILLVGGLSDVLDGWVARRRGEASALGAVIDPIADKVFALSIVITLSVRGPLPAWGVAALLTREILETPLVVWVLAHPPARRARAEDSKANALGKLATTVQFCAVLAALAGAQVVAPRWVFALLVASAVAGVTAGMSYWRRELSRIPPAP